MKTNDLHNGVAIAVARSSPPPEEVVRLFRVRLYPANTPDLESIPRPTIVFGAMPCERFASAVAADPNLAYVLVGDDQSGLGGREEWVDAVVPEPEHHHEIVAVGTEALLRKSEQHVPHCIVSDSMFAWRGHTADISELEAKIIRRLANARGAVVDKQALAYEIWGNYFCDPGRAVDTHVYRIRKRISHIEGVELVTERQRGFRLLLK
jgi:hypothetical protein